MRWIQRLRLFVQLDRIERKCDQILVNFAREENLMSQEFDDLKAAVAQVKTVDQSAITLIQGIAAKLADLAAQVAGTPAAADIAALASELQADSQGLADAVAANTPAAT